MKKTQFVIYLSIFTIILSACGSQPEPNDGNPNTFVVAVPKPEPPAVVIAIPYTIQQLAVRCGTADLASVGFVPNEMPQDCADFLRHGLRAKRLAEFAAAGISIEVVMNAIGQGNFTIHNSGADGATTALNMVVNGIRVIMIFGGVSNPTIFPIPNLKYGETLADSIAKWFTGENARFASPAEVTTELTETVKALGRCVSDQIKNRLIPEPVAKPVPVPAPEATSQVEYSTSMIVVEESFVTQDSYLATLSTEELQVLILVGAVVVVGVVVVATCVTTGCTATGPALALVVLVP